MDQELVDYLDRRFAENEEAIRRAVEQLGGETKAVREDLGSEIKAVREDLGSEIKAVRGEINVMREDLGGEIRHTQVMVEDLRSDLETVAEGVVDMGAKIDRYREESERARREDRAFAISLFQGSNRRAREPERCRPSFSH